MVLKNMKIDVRFINEEDLNRDKENLIELLEDNIKINLPNIINFTKYAIENYEDMLRFKKNDSAILIGAFYNEKIVGFIWAHKREVYGDSRLHIGHIVVNSKVRSGGIGTKLLNYLENYSIRENIKKIDLMATLANENTMKFYKANGFSIVRVQLEKEL